jgi:hypothetical protein
MSYPRSNFIAVRDDHRDETLEFLAGPPQNVRSTESAIDAALRSVPLPEGLLTRLRKWVYSMPEEAAGRIDCFGC